ncbi:hypothetical protein [Allopontixanthobacter sediminis]|nr:hypothetical protein [Allopontixanthobacter sediminis]
MSFREKSAWTMAAVMLVAGVFYAWLVSHGPGAPVIGPLVPYVMLVIILSVAVQIVLAVTSPKEAQAAADERERLILWRAGQLSGIVLAVGLVASGAVYVMLPSGNMLFHHVLGALIVAQIAEYLLQVYFFRRGH